jgi:polyisoprenoid-binding protein YceI
MTTNTSIHPDYIVGTWKLDPAHSSLSFSVRHLMISKARGVFKNFDVTIVTSDNPAESRVEATVDMASVDTGVEPRDQHLRTSDFFQVDEYPTMTFVSTSIDTKPSGEFTVSGDVTLRGVTKPIVITGEFNGLIDDPQGEKRAAATATTTINRKDFGVSYNAALEAGGVALGDDVTISLELQVLLQK